MEKAYSLIDWQDLPSEMTPINAENLNKMDKGINDIDDRVVALNKETIKSVSYDKQTGIVSIETKDGQLTQLDFSVIDPKRIPDMYYKEGGGRVEVMPETVLVVDEGLGGMTISQMFGLTAGETYTVSWNGNDYTCVCQENEDDDVMLACLGDVYTMSGGNWGTSATGEPFAIVIYPLEMQPDVGVAGVTFPLDGSTSATVSITQGEKETIHTIPEEYLGLDWLPKETVNETVLFEEQKITVTTDLSSTGNYHDYNLGLDKETRTKMVEEYDSLTLMIDGVKVELPYVNRFGEDGVYNTAYFTKTPMTSIDDLHQGISVGKGTNSRATIHLEIGEYTLKVSHITKSINQMPVEYLPGGVPYLCGGNVEILPEQDIPVLDAEDGMYGLTSDYPELVVGETYTVTYNGSKYTCVGQDVSAMQEGGVGIGDMATLELGNGNGEPFAVCYAPGTALVVIPLDGASAVKLAIETNGQIVRKLPEECLPESVDSVIIRSSTEGSTKKFKLTVDDSGRISATEIVE